MRYSIFRLLGLTTFAAMAFALWSAFDLIAVFSFYLGAFIVIATALMFPIVVLTSPQRGTQLDVAANPFSRILTISFLTGFGLMVLALVCISFNLAFM